MSRLSLRSQFVGLVLAMAVVTVACGSSGESTGADDAVTTVTASEGPATTTTTVPEVDAEGTQADAIVFDDEFCASIPEDVFVEATGATITEVRASGGIAFNDDIEYATSSCQFDLEDGGNISVEMLLDPETDEPVGVDYFDKLGEASRADTMSGHEHEDVDGIGDQAAFVADAFDNKLMVTTGGMVFFVSGKDGAFETLERPVVEKVATAAFADLG